MDPWARLDTFAQRLYHEDCRLLWTGDSMVAESGNIRVAEAAPACLFPNAWAGWIQVGYATSGGCPAQTIQTPVSGGNAVVTAHGFGNPAVGPDGGTTYSGVAADTAAYPTVFDDALWSGNDAIFTPYWKAQFLRSERLKFSGGDFLASTSTARMLLYRSATNGLSSCYINGTRNGVGQGSFNGAYALSAGYNAVDVSLGSGTDDAGCDFGADTIGTDETGKNLSFMGVRWSKDGATGLTMGFAGKGSSHVADHIDTSRVSDATLAALVSYFGINTVGIWIGQNDTADAAYNTALLALIQRWRAAIGSAARFLLVTQYQCFGTDAAKVATLAGYHRAAAYGASDVSWWNLGGIDDGFMAAQGTTYIGDLIHLTAAGGVRVMSRLHTDLTTALAGGDSYRSGPGRLTIPHRARRSRRPF